MPEPAPTRGRRPPGWGPLLVLCWLAAPTAWARLDLAAATVDRLDNGLTVIVLEEAAWPVVSVQMLYRAGAKHEPQGASGLAHFVEHMAFRDTENFPGTGVVGSIYAVGGEWHAYTWLDQTTYYATAPREQLDLLLRLAKRNKEMLALLFLDLDNFKRINDSLGHSAGDLLLREVGKRLSACVRDSDVVAHYVESNARIDVSRLGGDEFTVVLNQLDSTESAGVVAQRLISALIKPMIIDGHELVVTPSIGIAVAPQDAENVEELLKSADTAMYHAKSSGKNNFLFYNSDMDAAGVERLTLETDLRKALERNELVLHYQPQVDTLTGSVVGAEALMRWAHPEQGLIPPFKFIPLAEEMGLIRALGEWGLQEACRQMIEFQGMGLDLPKVSVNVSALQFNKSFIARVGEVLHETALKPSRLELELTEGIMMDDTDATINALDELKEMGVSLSIDDFGTGYSSLSYLSRFPLDELKIDRSFVVDYDKSRNDSSLIIAIIAMGRSMNLQLVAEGVETDGQYHFLRQHGAHIIQGYLFSPPVPAGDLAPMLSPGYFREKISQIGAG